ncbi:hypothetical protein ACT3SZ_14965 [Corynebacterium sp. AOP40-9SA-29]|uniref:hypothetical protein n=1 Tax=Corynebacterium sp. AOP40-9SA-29 TaxID=3457677 RepID=UPI00403345A0
MATQMQRQRARRRSFEIREAEQRRLEAQLKEKAKAREEAFVSLDQVDAVHAAAGKALRALLDSGDSREEVMEIFDLNKGELQGYLRAAKEYRPEDVDEDGDVDNEGAEDADAESTEPSAEGTQDREGDSGSSDRSSDSQSSPSYA